MSMSPSKMSPMAPMSAMGRKLQQAMVSNSPEIVGSTDVFCNIFEGPSHAPRHRLTGPFCTKVPEILRSLHDNTGCISLLVVQGGMMSMSPMMAPMSPMGRKLQQAMVSNALSLLQPEMP